MGVVTDAATSDDFARVRALPTWPEFEARISGMPSADAASKAPATSASAPKVVPPAAKPGTAKADAAKPEPPGPEPAPVAATTKPAARAAGPLSFSAPGLDAVGLAYDAVSGRFIVGDRKDRRLLVVGRAIGPNGEPRGRRRRLRRGYGVRDRCDRRGPLGRQHHEPIALIHRAQAAADFRPRLSSIRAASEDWRPRSSPMSPSRPQNILVLDSEGRRIFAPPRRVERSRCRGRVSRRPAARAGAAGRTASSMSPTTAASSASISPTQARPWSRRPRRRASRASWIRLLPRVARRDSTGGPHRADRPPASDQAR